MAQTNSNIRIDEELKEQFNEFCSDIGMSMTTAFCIFAKKLSKNMNHLRRGIEALHVGKGAEHEIFERVNEKDMV